MVPNRDVDGGSLHCPVCGASYPEEFSACPRDGTPLASGHDKLIGVVLRDTYRITAVIGEGALGRVYKAEHVRLPRTYAIKVPRGMWIDHAKSRARFFNEASAAGRLAHPNIAGVVDFGETDQGVPYLVMEYAVGEPLTALIHRGPTPIAKAFAMVRAMAQGLEHAHALGIVHRDLKPDNVLVDGDTPRIVDFGIALVTDLGERGRFTTKGIVIGTPGYMAPEQLLDEPLDARTDLYPLGVMLYELVSGRRAYEGTAVEIAHNTISAPPPPLAERLPWLAIDARIDALCRHLMARRPADRPANATAVIATLDAMHVPESRRALTPSTEPPIANVALEPTLQTPTFERVPVRWWSSLRWWRKSTRRVRRE